MNHRNARIGMSLCLVAGLCAAIHAQATTQPAADAPAPTPAPTSAPPEALIFDLLAMPTGVDSKTPALTTGAGGTILSWVEGFSLDAVEMRYSRFGGKHLGLPVAVKNSAGILALADDPATVLPLADGSLVASWPGAGVGACDVRVSTYSKDTGKWSAPISPHVDGANAERGFASLLELGDGRVACFWIDGRALGNDGASALYVAILADGKFGAETMIDDRACDCCPTSAVLADGRAHVFYRDRSSDEVRDIAHSSVAITGDLAPTAPQMLAKDGWRMPSCPVNGPAAAASADGRIAVAWFTFADGDRRVLLSFSSDGGKSFDPALRIDNGLPAGKVDLIWFEEQSVLLAWMEGLPGRRDEVTIREVRADGTRGESLAVTQAYAAPQGRPALEKVAGGALLAWTEAAAKPTVKAALVRRKE